MNFLAHLYLSCNDEDILMGNFIADMIRNKELRTLKTEIMHGVELHRKIDSFTDKHPMFRSGVVRLRPSQSKYAPVVLDILYDFLLACNWEKYSESPLNEFITNVYSVLERRIDDVPERLGLRIPLMIEDDFLHQYTSYQGLEKAMKRMDRRARFPSNFVGSVQDLKTDFSLFEQEFNQLFPDLIQKVSSWCEIR